MEDFINYTLFFGIAVINLNFMAAIDGNNKGKKKKPL